MGKEKYCRNCDGVLTDEEQLLYEGLCTSCEREELGISYSKTLFISSVFTLFLMEIIGGIVLGYTTFGLITIMITILIKGV